MFAWLKKWLGPPEQDDTLVAWKKWTVPIGDQTLRVEVGLDSADVDSNPAMAYTEAILELLKKQDGHFEQAAAAQLTKVYNENWNVGEAIDEAEFMRRLKPISLVVTGTERESLASVLYDSDEMFTSHAVSVILDASGDVEEVLIV